MKLIPFILSLPPMVEMKVTKGTAIKKTLVITFFQMETRLMNQITITEEFLQCMEEDVLITFLKEALNKVI